MNTIIIALNLLAVNPQPVAVDVIAAPAIQCPLDPAGMYQDQEGGN